MIDAKTIIKTFDKHQELQKSLKEEGIEILFMNIKLKDKLINIDD